MIIRHVVLFVDITGLIFLKNCTVETRIGLRNVHISCKGWG